MIIKKITQAGNPILRKNADLVKNLRSQKTKRTIRDLIDTMRSSSLVGIAAPQIGRSFRIFITEIRKTANRKVEDKDELRIFINPRITRFSKKTNIGYEGCGSVGNAQIFGPVKRADEITIEALNEKGEKFVLKAQDLLARVIQHEFDHINGIIFTDKISDYKKIMSREEYRKFSKIEKS
ncbi:MAG: peptide deformylase [Candidatus Moranbacteria bacterium]|nr:peptide deformylase [Candidatus Moranbacteria bacterium]